MAHGGPRSRRGRGFGGWGFRGGGIWGWVARRRVYVARRAQRSLGGGAAVLVGAILDQLDVVVAVAPEELLGGAQRTGVVVALERPGRRTDHSGQFGEHRQIQGLPGRRVAGGLR